MTETKHNVRHKVVVRATVAVLLILVCMAIAWQNSAYRTGFESCRGKTVNEWLKSGDAKTPLRELGPEKVLPYYKKLLQRHRPDSPRFFDNLSSLADPDEQPYFPLKSIEASIIAALNDLTPDQVSTMVFPILVCLSRGDASVHLNAPKFFCEKRGPGVMNELIKATRASDRVTRGYALRFLAEYGSMAKAAAPDLLADFKQKQDSQTLFALAYCAPDLELLPPLIAQVALMKDTQTHERTRAVKIMIFLGKKRAAPFARQLEATLDETIAFVPAGNSEYVLDEFHAEVLLALEALGVKEGQTVQLLKRFENARPSARLAAARLFWYRTNDMTALEPTLKDLTRIPPETISSCFRYKPDLSGFATDPSNTCRSGDHPEGIYLTVNSALALFLREIGREDLLPFDQIASEDVLNHPVLENVLYARAQAALNEDARDRYRKLFLNTNAFRGWKPPEREALQALIKEMLSTIE